MKGIRLGDYNQLTAVKKVDFGLYLDGGDEGEILLPARYVPQGCKPGDELTVFVYLDQDERPVATTEKPLAKVGDFAYLEVAWVNEYGAFLNWGLMKDLFCPFREQKMRMVKGNSYIVYVTLDDMPIEGFIHVSALGWGYWEFDESSMTMRSDEELAEIRLGESVRVFASEVDPEARRIDFRMEPRGPKIKKGRRRR